MANQMCRGVIICLALLVCAVGCSSSYSAPGHPADFKALGMTREQLTDSSINQALSKQPLAQFPCGIAAVRIQAPGYESKTAHAWGEGNYCVITTRDIEGNQLDRLAKLKDVAGIVTLNRLVLPSRFTSDRELRQAAAELHADMVLIYTIDTSASLNDEAAALTVLTLGVSPNQVVHMISTASAVLLDTRDGYLYGYAEATERQDQLANGWGADATVDDARRRTEGRAFEKLVGQLEKTWPTIDKTYAVPAAAQTPGTTQTPSPTAAAKVSASVH